MSPVARAMITLLPSMARDLMDAIHRTDALGRNRLNVAIRLNRLGTSPLIILEDLFLGHGFTENVAKAVMLF